MHAGLEDTRSDTRWEPSARKRSSKPSSARTFKREQLSQATLQRLDILSGDPQKLAARVVELEATVESLRKDNAALRQQLQASSPRAQRLLLHQRCRSIRSPQHRPAAYRLRVACPNPSVQPASPTTCDVATTQRPAIWTKRRHSVQDLRRLTLVAVCLLLALPGV
jgi:hypothetical protein